MEILIFNNLKQNIYPKKISIIFSKEAKTIEKDTPLPGTEF